MAIQAPVPRAEQKPVKTIYTTVYIPMTVVRYVDARGVVVSIKTFVGSADIALDIASGVPIDVSRIEDIVRYMALAPQIGMSPEQVLYSYVPPPPRYTNISIPSPPSDPSMRRLWERNVVSIVQQLADVNTRRAWLSNYLSTLRPQLVQRLAILYDSQRAVDLAERTITDVLNKAYQARNVWDLYQIEQSISLDNLIDMASSYA